MPPIADGMSCGIRVDVEQAAKGTDHGPDGAHSHCFAPIKFEPMRGLQILKQVIVLFKVVAANKPIVLPKRGSM